MVDLLELAEEPFKQVLVVEPVDYPAGLSDGVHSKHGSSDVDGLDSCL